MKYFLHIICFQAHLIFEASQPPERVNQTLKCSGAAPWLGDNQLVFYSRALNSAAPIPKPKKSSETACPKPDLLFSCTGWIKKRSVPTHKPNLDKTFSTASCPFCDSTDPVLSLPARQNKEFDQELGSVCSVSQVTQEYCRAVLSS